jgi:nicotinate-nucleotide adenylyltransferase
MFDPIHRGHLDLADAAEAALGLAHVFIIPANIPPHRPQPVASNFHRFAMAALAVAEHPSWRASDLELLAQTPSYTSTTLRAFHARGYDRSELFFLSGADAFLEIVTWKDYPQLLDFAHFVVVSRPGHPVSELAARLPQLAPRMVSTPIATVRPVGPRIILIDATTLDVSSTAIRSRCSAGESIQGLVDPKVQQHIEQHGLYRHTLENHGPIEHPSNEAAGRLHAQSRQRDR